MSRQYLAHHGIKGQKWGERRYQNEDGTLTPAGKQRYDSDSDESKAARIGKNIGNKTSGFANRMATNAREGFTGEKEIDRKKSILEKTVTVGGKAGRKLTNFGSRMGQNAKEGYTGEKEIHRKKSILEKSVTFSGKATKAGKDFVDGLFSVNYGNTTVARKKD